MSTSRGNASHARHGSCSPMAIQVAPAHTSKFTAGAAMTLMLVVFIGLALQVADRFDTADA